MEYTTKDIRRNMMITFISNIMIGFFLGFRDLSTTMQILFNKVGGDSLLVLINQITYYTLVVCLLVIGVNIQKTRLKYKIIIIDMITYLTYLGIAVLLMFNKLTGEALFFLMLINMIANRLLAVLSIDFKMKIIPKERFKKFLGDTTFVLTIANVIGMYASYLVIKEPFPNNFIIIMFAGFIIGSIINFMSAFFVESSEKRVKNRTENNISLKSILKISREKNFIYMNVGKTFLNVAYALLILYAMYAMRLGYSASNIVMFGLMQYTMKAVFSILAPKLNISSRQNMMIGHALIGLTVIVTWLTRNFYVGFALWGIGEAYINLGYYAYMNSLGEEKKHIYLTGQTFFNVTIGFALPIITIILDLYGFKVVSFIALIMAMISIFYIEKLEETEETEVHIFHHLKREWHGQ